MERCSLRLALAATVGASDRALQLSDLPLRVEVYRVQEPRVMGLRGISYRTRPQQIQPLTSWEVLNADTTLESPEFACPSGTLQTFELTCEGNDCLLSLAQIPHQNDLGMSCTHQALVLQVDAHVTV